MTTGGELVLEVTSRCPLSCIHCSSDSDLSTSTSLDPSAALRAITEAHLLDFGTVSFGGGEPTSSPIFMEAVEHALHLDMDVEVFTSGVAFDGSSYCPLSFKTIRALADPKVKIIFSLHGGSPAVHDRITGLVGSFQITTGSIQSVMAIGKAININFVPLKENVGDFDNLVQVIRQLGVAQLSLLRFVAHGRGYLNREALLLDREEESSFLRHVLALRDQGLPVRFGSPYNHLILGNNVRCRAGVSKLVVQPNGNVIPCEAFKSARLNQWALSIYRDSIGKMLGSNKVAGLAKHLVGSDFLRCPVHDPT